MDTQATDTGAFTWALISPERQSLLTAGTIGTARDYMDSVVFKWHVQAVSEGQNTARIVLHLIYVYLDGSEHDGSIEVSQAPIPMVAVQTFDVEHRARANTLTVGRRLGIRRRHRPPTLHLQRVEDGQRRDRAGERRGKGSTSGQGARRRIAIRR